MWESFGELTENPWSNSILNPRISPSGPQPQYRPSQGWKKTLSFCPLWGRVRVEWWISCLAHRGSPGVCLHLLSEGSISGGRWPWWRAAASHSRQYWPGWTSHLIQYKAASDVQFNVCDQLPGVLDYLLGTVEEPLSSECLSTSMAKHPFSMLAAGMSVQRRSKPLASSKLPPALPHEAAQLCEPREGQGRAGWDRAPQMHVPRGPWRILIWHWLPTIVSFVIYKINYQIMTKRICFSPL